MRWMLEVTYIGLITSWKWVMGSTVVVVALIGLLFGIGVFGGDGEDGGTNPPSVAVSPMPTPAANPSPTLAPRPVPTAEPTAVPVAAKFVSVPILATRADNVGSLEFVLVYDPAKLELAQVERGLLSGDALIDSNSPRPGRLWAGIIDINGINGSGPVAVVKFMIRDNVGGTMPFSLESVAAFDANTLVDIVTGTTPGELSGPGTSLLSPIVTFQ